LKDFEEFLKKEENRIIMDGIKDKMEKAKQDLKDYEEINGEDDGSELVDIADLMVEN